MSTFAVIIPAAGQSSRFVGFDEKKPFVELLGIPVWQRTVDQFLHLPMVAELVLVMAADDRENFERKFETEIAERGIQIVTGGASRAESVLNGLTSLKSEAEFVAVHDAARPLITAKQLASYFDFASRHPCVIPGVPVTSTVKRVSNDQIVVETVDREALRLAQTPQVCHRASLQNAYDQAADLRKFTDESSLMEAAGHAVKIAPGWPENIKITTAEDFQLAEFFLKKRQASTS